ncbi:methyltransferase domain-containing protein [Gloeobacter kilaueensis]|uniref:Thiopurine S-methyltransferase n=1 Tax=Gloeobacter kilaueensis (strain ATCC BAA-2537 / CCAP 1431/1 / ULC 316 / JS1) TaxID=1183438 RepID=U5QP03_GLOK1|nr:methyltransferase domain-containing protein [Gloeobacter kilaueensis]AGY60676.1 thiopurine S-methyltransferase [Gloeobacter kilaueensis JS1]
MASEELPSLNQPVYWESRYRQHQDRWDLGRPAPSFEYLLATPQAPPPGTVVVPGCGRGYDALLFASRGYKVYGFDFAADAIADATRSALRSGISVTFVQEDLFKLPRELDSLFDLVIEHTCFCAIDPSRRPEYVQIVHRLLRPGAELIAIFFAHPRPGGPPFRTDPDEIERLFGGYFAIEQLEPAPVSVPERQGEELFARLRRL